MRQCSCRSSSSSGSGCWSHAQFHLTKRRYAHIGTRAAHAHAQRALLRARDDHLLLEQRGPDARVAKGKRTCFGGKREAGETPEEAMHRELREELGGVWMPSPAPERACDLYVDGQLIAYFYTASAPDDAAAATLTYETGRRGAWMPRDIAATDPAVSPWHRCVLQAWLRGERRADFDSSGDEAGKREEGDGDGGAGTTGAEEAALSNGGAAW